MSSFEFMKRAAEESKKRSMSAIASLNSLWNMRLPGFYIKPGSSTKVMLLNAGHHALMHELAISFKEGRRRPSTDTIRCQIWTFDEQGNWVHRPGVTQCVLCKALGTDPRYTTFWAAMDYQPFQDRRTNMTYPCAVKIVECTQDQVRGNILAICEKMGPHFGHQTPSTVGAMFEVGRSQQQMSARIGDIWTFSGYGSPQDLEPLLPYVPNFEALWPLMNDADLMPILARHRALKDRFQYERLGYSPEGMAELGIQGVAASQPAGRAYSMPPMPGQPAPMPQGGQPMMPPMPGAQMAAPVAPAPGAHAQMPPMPATPRPQMPAMPPMPQAPQAPGPQQPYRPQAGPPAPSMPQSRPPAVGGTMPPQPSAMPAPQPQGQPAPMPMAPPAAMPPLPQPPAPGGPSLDDLEDLPGGQGGFQSWPGNEEDV